MHLQRVQADAVRLLPRSEWKSSHTSGSPTITTGPDAGDSIALDHVRPRSIVPELAARFYNLEAVPSGANLSKSKKIGKRELDLARRWNSQGLMAAAGLKTVEMAWRR